ncbi:MAG: bifunctional glutamate N-acetyltransferase/amino-acid acetyltransferase ArgJ [Planctomyces sp.]|nr:bifunctional glutamate N-acetyltransferase/amino-acid acetyltransferase ArgJ [Planctomyces sp.]
MALPTGFLAGGVACGIKSDPTTPDLALFASDRPATSAGVFTTNRVVGAPVKVSRERIGRTGARAVLINSGNSNACTGERGIKDALWMTAEVAARLGCVPQDVLICSTGVIGRFLPTDRIATGIGPVVDSLVATEVGFLAAARAMMTTDTVPKQASQTVSLGGRPVTIAGACKGAAMIAPNMATMLGVLMTDVRLAPRDAQSLLAAAVEDTFNSISVDQHQSTSDTVLLLANGASGVELTGESRETFQGALTDVCRELATHIIRDAEGASHFVTIDVVGCRDRCEARRMARSVADSPLVKTAIAGNDPNWGRIVSAAGYAGVPFEERECSLSINDIEVYRSGAPTDFQENAVSAAMRTGEVRLTLTFTHGSAAARFWTCDLTAEYVRLNADYTT